MMVSDYELHKNSTAITLRDKGIVYRDFQLMHEAQWSIFSQFKFYQNHLLCIVDESNLDDLMISSNEIAEGQYRILAGFIKENFPNKIIN